MAVNAHQTRRLNHALDTLWHIMSAPQVTAALFALLALTLGLAAIFPQLPAGLEDAETERWLTATANRFPGVGTFFSTINIFDLLHSTWAHVLSATLALNLMLRMAVHGRFLWGLRHQTATPLSPLRAVTRRAALPGPLERTLASLRTALEPRYAVTIESDTARGQLFAQRRPIGALGPLLTDIGLLLLLAGLVVQGAVGWRARDLALAPGSEMTLNRPGTPQISLRDVSGDDATARANLAVTRAGSRRSVQTGPARPAYWGNLWLSQQATGPALAVTGLENNGRALVLQSLGPDNEVGPVLRVLFRQTQSEQGFAIPTRNLTFRAVSYAALPEQGFSGPVFLVEAYRGEEAVPAVTELVEDEGKLALDDITLTLRQDRYVILEMAYLPGLIPIALGSLLALAGIVIVAYWGIARVWAYLALDGEDVVAIMAVAGPASPQAEIEHLLCAARSPFPHPGATLPASPDHPPMSPDHSPATRADRPGGSQATDVTRPPADVAGLQPGDVTHKRRVTSVQLPAKTVLIGVTLALLAVAVSVGWPGTAPADSLSMLAGGGLLVAAWRTWHDHQCIHRRCGPLRYNRSSTEPRTTLNAVDGLRPSHTPNLVLGLTLIGAAALLAAAAALTATSSSSPALPAPLWLFGVRNVLASIGLGGWLPALAASLHWYAQTMTGSSMLQRYDRSSPEPRSGDESSGGTSTIPVSDRATAALPPVRPETVKPAEDPGRIAALLGFPWLTAACLASGAWNMVTHAAIGRAVPADLWLLAAWLLGGAYLNATSSWQPLRLPGWLPPLIAAGALTAGVLAASTAGSLR